MFIIPSFENLFIEEANRLGLEVKTKDCKSIGSTDVGNVSHVCPTIHPSWNIMAPGEVYSTHTVEFREATLRQPAKDALMVNVCAMAMAGKEILDDPELLAEIKREFAEAVAND